MAATDHGLEIIQRDAGDWTIVSVRGEVDLSTTPQLREALTTAAGSGSAVAVDVREVPFMDSMGLGVLVGARRRAGESGTGFALISDGGPIIRLLDVSGLGTMFRVVSDEGEL
jgi:anti-sigma B factor antagonist